MTEPRVTFEAFLEAELGSLLRFAAVLTGDAALAEDVLQEFLIRATARWDSIGRIGPASRLRAQDGRERSPSLPGCPGASVR
jgi:DNA-directed RNA polymerase specialized sigma24 family protein